MEVPVWLKHQLDGDGLQRIRASVEAAEKKTCAEIVPMIVRESSQTGHVIVVIFFALLAILFCFSPLLVAPATSLGLPLSALELGGVLAAGGVAWALSRIESVRRLCTPRADRISSALLRAQLEFYEAGITGTSGRTGLLIFVSFLERQAVVLADQAIAAKFKQETWDEVVHLLTERVHAGDFAEGMCRAIKRCGELLERDFPRSADDADELPNRLIIEP